MASRPAVLPLALFGAAAACLLVGALPMLAAFGMLEGDEPIEPLGRVVAFFFGLVFVGFGAVLAAVPLYGAARARGATTVREAVTLARRHLVRRVDVNSILAAGGVLALGVACWAALGGAALPLLDRGTLTGLVVLELVVLHGFPFLVTAATFFRAPGAFRVAAIGIFALVAVNVTVVSWVFGGGLEGLAWTVYLLAGNVLAFAHKHPEAGVRARAVSRWAVKFVLFILLAATIGGGELQGPGALRLGAVYFTVMAVVELFRLVELPVDLARAAGKRQTAVGSRS